MKKQKMLISLAGLVVAVATTATVAAYTLGGDGSSAPAAESPGNQEPALHDDKLPTFDLGPGQISKDGRSVSVSNPDVKVDDPPAGKVLPDGGGVVPIGKVDGGPSLHGDPEPTVGPEVKGDAPDIEPLLGQGPVGELPGTIDPPEYVEVLELAKRDLVERLGLPTTDPIRLEEIAKVEWGNTSLGNPQPGIFYAEVIVPGFKILLEADGNFYVYHTSLEEAVLVEASGIPVTSVGSQEVVAVVPVLNPEEDVEVLDDQAVRVGPGTGLLIDPLLATGAEVKLSGEVVSEGIFSVDGRVLEVNGERVLVMDYGDADSLDVEAAGISPDGSSIGTHMVSWVAPPHFFRTETAIVLYVGENSEVIEALAQVMGPQFAGR